jgi:transposase-like protein
VDEDGFMLDILLQYRRKKAAAGRLLRKLLKKHMRPPLATVQTNSPASGCG